MTLPAVCRVYWGSHGCHLPRGHDGDHWCNCCECPDHAKSNVDDEGAICAARPPYYGPDTQFYGEDAPDQATDARAACDCRDPWCRECFPEATGTRATPLEVGDTKAWVGDGIGAYKVHLRGVNIAADWTLRNAREIRDALNGLDLDGRE